MMTREEAIAEYERARITLYALRTQNADLLAALERLLLVYRECLNALALEYGGDKEDMSHLNDEYTAQADAAIAQAREETK